MQVDLPHWRPLLKTSDDFRRLNSSIQDITLPVHRTVPTLFALLTSLPLSLFPHALLLAGSGSPEGLDSLGTLGSFDPRQAFAGNTG